MKGSQEKIGLLPVKMEQGTGPCLKLLRSSVPSHSELAFAQRALQGDETVCDPFGVPAETLTSLFVL